MIGVYGGPFCLAHSAQTYIILRILAALRHSQHEEKLKHIETQR